MEASLLLKTAFIIYQVVLAENWDTCFKNQYYTCEHQLLDCFRAITMVAIHLKMENPRDMSQVQKSSIYERGSKILETWARFTLDEECGDRMLVGASIGRDRLERKFIKSDAKLPCTGSVAADMLRYGQKWHPAPNSWFPIPNSAKDQVTIIHSQVITVSQMYCWSLLDRIFIRVIWRHNLMLSNNMYIEWTNRGCFIWRWCRLITCDTYIHVLLMGCNSRLPF